MTVSTLEREGAQAETGLWARLKGGTRAVHSRLDARITEGRPFESRERYGIFVAVQHDFHQLVSPLYQSAELGRLLPDLGSRDRLAAIEQDLRDLGLPFSRQVGRADYEIDIPNALGWLYVAEGSNLGAAFLLKSARDLGLSEEFGARHLAGAPEGRGLHWRRFTAALDALDLGPAEEARVMQGADDAFAAVLGFVEKRYFGGSS